MFLCLNCNSIKRHNVWRNIHHFRSRQVGWLVVLRINVFSHISTWKQEITNLWKFKWRGRESNPGPLAPQAKSLTSRPPLLLRSRQAIWSYILIFPKKNGNIPFTQQESIEIILVCQTADLTCNHSHCIWRVYSTAFLLAPTLITLWVLYQN